MKIGQMHKEFKAMVPETGIIKREQLSPGTSTPQQALLGLQQSAILSCSAGPLCRAAAASSSSPFSLLPGGGVCVVVSGSS